jgi:ABC-type nitrate/sulfonate/bicarbonate transport system permease component
VFVVAPAAMPYVAAGVRICATLCLLLAIGSELIAGVPGLGQEILLSQQAGASPRMFALTLVAGALGAAVSVVLTVGEHKLLAWHHRPRAAM